MEKCENCLQEIAEEKYPLHFSYCIRNVVLCSHCQQPYDKNNLKDQPHECQASRKNGMASNDQGPSKNVAKSRFCEYCLLDVPLEEYDEHTLYCESRSKECQLCHRMVINKNFAEHIVACEKVTTNQALLESQERNSIQQQETITANKFSNFAGNRCFSIQSDNALTNAYSSIDDSGSQQGYSQPVPDVYRTTKNSTVTGVMPEHGQPIKVVKYVHSKDGAPIGSRGPQTPITVNHTANVIGVRQTVIRREPVSMEEYMKRKKKEAEEEEQRLKQQRDAPSDLESISPVKTINRVYSQASGSNLEFRSISEQLQNIASQTGSQGTSAHNSDQTSKEQKRVSTAVRNANHFLEAQQLSNRPLGTLVRAPQYGGSDESSSASISRVTQSLSRPSEYSSRTESNSADRNMPSTAVPDTRTTNYTTSTEVHNNSQSSYYPPYNPSQTRSQRCNMEYMSLNGSQLPQMIRTSSIPVEHSLPNSGKRECSRQLHPNSANKTNQIQQEKSNIRPSQYLDNSVHSQNQRYVHTDNSYSQNRNFQFSQHQNPNVNQDEEAIQMAIMASIGMTGGEEDFSLSQSAQLYEDIRKQHEIERSFSGQSKK